LRQNVGVAPRARAEIEHAAAALFHAPPVALRSSRGSNLRRRRLATLQDACGKRRPGFRVTAVLEFASGSVSGVSADSDHVDVLRRGPRAWNAWRRQHPSIVPNLPRVFWSVSERQMVPMNGGPINLSSARLRRASLRFATLSG